jgi:hypothetical protein
MLVLVAAVPATGWAADPKEQLDKVVDIEKSYEGPTSLLLDYLAERYEVKIVIDKAAFAKEGIKLPNDRTVGTPKLRGFALDTILRLILPQVDAVYEVRGNELVFVPNREGKQRRQFPPISEQAVRQRKAYRERLEKIEVETEKEFDGPLETILEYLSDRNEFSIIVDEYAFQKKLEMSDVEKATVKLKPTKAPLLKVLEELAGQVKGQYEFHRDHVRIVPRNTSKS